MHRAARVYIHFGRVCEILTFGKNWFVNDLKNCFIQRMMQGQKNDGLVTEKSVSCIDPTRHCNNYSAYPQVNHTFLKDNMEIHLRLKEWIDKLPL